VIESDDWGSIRMSSRRAFDRLANHGVDLHTGDSLRYNLYDTLASREDMEALFNVLRGIRDRNGQNPVFTALCLVANPDFEKIQEAGFGEYYYESLVRTHERYYPNQNVFQLWKQGMERNLFKPQFHGREHLNVQAWMRALNRGDRDTRLAFEEGIWGFNNKHVSGLSFQAAFDLEHLSDLTAHMGILKDGLRLFEELFGYKASFFVPPNGILHESLYPGLSELGINYLYSSKLHPVPVEPGQFTTRLNYLGKKTKVGQRFITRNAFFEPSTGLPGCVVKCLNEIETAFRFRRPAIISSHRVNYIGVLDESNRARGLDQLKELLESVVRRWPEVEFMSTSELGNLMESE